MEPDNNSSGRKTFRLEEAGAKVLADFKKAGRISTENDAINQLLTKYPQLQRNIEALIRERDQLQTKLSETTKQRDAAVKSEAEIRSALKFVGGLLNSATA